MTTRASYDELGALEEACDSIRARAAHLAEIARELEVIADAEVPDEQVRSTTRVLEELDRLLAGDDAFPEALAGIPGLDQVLEHHEQLVDED
jgi:hypothetical protein